jgi:hypothetical protein
MSTSHRNNVTINKKLERLLQKSENLRCADCNDVKPTWTVLVKPPATARPDNPTMGLFCCLHCSAAHQSVGNDGCKIKSIKLDSWNDDEVHAVHCGGNLRINAIFEGSLHDDTTKPTPSSEARVREQFIYEKYTQLKYFVANAYSHVESEEEDSSKDEDILDETNPISFLSQSTTSFCSTVGKAPMKFRLSSLLVSSLHDNLPPMSKMHRQSSLPNMMLRSVIADPCLTPRSTKVSNILALKKIASPFRAGKDFWESMNSSTWGDMTFEDSLHKKSSNDMQNRDRRSSWGLTSDHSMPPLVLDSEVSDDSTHCRNEMRRMPKKAVSERKLWTCFEDSLPRTPRASNGVKKTGTDRQSLVNRQKSSPNVQTENLRNSKPRKERHTIEKSEGKSSQSPSKQRNTKNRSVLDLLEEENAGQALGERSSRKSQRHQSGTLKPKSPRSLPREQLSQPTSSFCVAYGLQNSNHNGKSPRFSRGRSLRCPDKMIDHAGQITTTRRSSRSLNPKNCSKRCTTHSQNEQRYVQCTPTSTARSLSMSEISQSDSIPSPPYLNVQGQRADQCRLKELGSEMLTRRPLSADATERQKHRRASMALVKTPPPPPTHTPKSMPCRRKTPKVDGQVKGLDGSLHCLTGTRITSDGAKNGRPKSLEASKKSRLRRTRETNIGKEGPGDDPFQHPLFAYPIITTP